MGRAHECIGIRDMIPLLRDIANLVPIAVYPLFEKYIVDRWKRVGECLLQSPDINVRTAIS
jgi:hypothetical protein